MAFLPLLPIVPSGAGSWEKMPRAPAPRSPHTMPRHFRSRLLSHGRCAQASLVDRSRKSETGMQTDRPMLGARTRATAIACVTRSRQTCASRPQGVAHGGPSTRQGKLKLKEKSEHTDSMGKASLARWQLRAPVAVVFATGRPARPTQTTASGVGCWAPWSQGRHGLVR